MLDEIAIEAFEDAKAASVGQLLFKAARLMNEAALVRVRKATGHRIRTAHTRLFPHIDLQGTRLTELARRAGISKQAAGQLVDELVSMGSLERVPDPTDRRAKRIRFPLVDGELSLMHGLRTLGSFEAELARSVGPAQWQALHTGLTALLEQLEPTEACSSDRSPADPP